MMTLETNCTIDTNHALRQHVRQVLDQYFQTIQHTTIAELNLHEMVIHEVEPAVIEYALDYTQGNKTRAAQMLGLTRNTLRKKIEQYNLS